MKSTNAKGLKILFYDIETTPNLGYVWGKYQQDVLAFTQRRQLLSIAYSYEGSSEIFCETREGQKTDERLVKRLHEILSDADIVIAHNGDSFDQKVARARMLYHGLKPLKILSTVDTKKAAYSHFMFDGNSLDNLAEYLKVGRKLPTPGFSLWQGCMHNNPKSWRLMEKYNKNDVKLLKAVYAKLKPWIGNHPSIGRLIDPHRHALRCPTCGGKHVQSRGYRTTRTRTYRRWHCQSPSCEAWFESSINETGARK